MREGNRQGFIRIVSANPGIKLLSPFKFSRHGADAVQQLSHDLVNNVGETFRVVGGKGELDVNRLEAFVKRLGTDDRLSIDGEEFVVEYDERLHYTTFRGSTLTSTLYERLRVGFNLPDYASACGTVPITGSSGRAHNDAAHRHFKCPGAPGECRHRQRAFYDFLKDVLFGLGLEGLPKIIRVSDLTDFIDGHSLGEIVGRATSVEGQSLTMLLRERARFAARKA